MKPDSTHSAFGFSLIEVIVAVAIFAGSVVAILGLLSPASQSVEDVLDSYTANRLTENIRAELSRMGFDEAVSLTGGANTILLVAMQDGERVLLLDDPGGGPPADRALNDPTLPGMAERDRYFIISLGRQTGDLAYSPTSGFLALRANVSWAYQRPVGPATNTVSATGSNADGFRSVPPSERRTISYYFAIKP